MSNTKPTPAAGSEEFYTQIGDVLTRLENSVEQSTVARINGRTMGNRMIHAKAITEVYDLIAAQSNATYEAVMEAITDWCQCDGGYVITGGKSMEDDLIETEPCDECAELRQNIAKIFGKEAK